MFWNPILIHFYHAYQELDRKWNEEEERNAKNNYVYIKTWDLFLKVKNLLSSVLQKTRPLKFLFLLGGGSATAVLPEVGGANGIGIPSGLKLKFIFNSNNSI